MKVLEVLPRLPVPAHSGNTLRTLYLIKGLAKTAEIDVLSIAHSIPTKEDLEELTKHCHHVYLANWRKQTKWQQVPGILYRCVSGEPFHTKYVESLDLQRKLGELTRSCNYDVVVIQHSLMAGYVRFLPPDNRAKTVLEMHDVNEVVYLRRFLKERNFIEKTKLLLTWFSLRRWESRMAARFDMLVTVSERDKAIFLARRRDLNITVIPNGVDTQANEPLPLDGREENLLFVGSMDYGPNADAALYLGNEIFPLIRRRCPACSLIIVGKEPPSAVRSLANQPGIMIAADVPDVRPYYRRALIAVVPLRSGSGTRLKILESMALGTPVVSTSIGCEGLDVQDGRHILVADRPDAFAECVERLLMDADLWKHLAQEARRLVVERYDWRYITELYRLDLERLVRT